MRIAPVFLVFTLLFAGCVDPPAEPSAPDPSPRIPQDEPSDHDAYETEASEESPTAERSTSPPHEPVKDDGASEHRTAPVPVPEPEPPAPPAPVIAIIDSGINPYHLDFRPGKTMGLPPGFPDVKTLNLTLDAPTYEAAVEADKETLRKTTLETPYRIPGTRVLVTIDFGDNADCFPNDCATPILDYDGHGTAVASAGFGNHEGVFPDVWLVIIKKQGDIRDEMEWVLKQDWIDAVSMSNIGGAYQIDTRGVAGEYSQRWVNSGRPWFNGAGNSIYASGPVNHPSGNSGPSWSFVIGEYHAEDPYEHGNTRTFDLVAQTNIDTAVYDSLSGYIGYNSGTSLASPRAAAYALRLIADAREILGGGYDPDTGELAVWKPDHVIPRTGPLADGNFTLADLEAVLKAAARPLGPQGPMAEEEPYSYWFGGHGLVDEEAYDAAKRMLEGKEPIINKPWATWWETHDDHARDRYWAFGHCYYRLTRSVDPNGFVDCIDSHKETPPPLPDPEDVPPPES